jgi:20S proteasome alpha/beta subunit
MAKITKTNFINASKDSGGIQSVVAQKIGCERQAINQFIKKNEWARELLDAEREKIIDLAENKLFKAADDGKEWAIERILKSLGKRRGYTEKTEIDSVNTNLNLDVEAEKKLGEILQKIRDGTPK